MAENHLHLYKRVKWGGKHVYRCMRCSHYLYPEFLQGRQAECPVCHQEFTIGIEDTYRKVPHCRNCNTRKPKAANKPKASPEMVDTLRKVFEL